MVAKPDFKLPEAYEWERDAACRDLPPDMFYPHHYNADISAALAACRQCPVRQQCWRAADETREEHGIWAGTTPRQRRKRWRDQSRSGCADMA